MREAACHIVPLRAGGGTRLKILNSWAMGKAVVSTSVGCEGLAAEAGENILIRDDPTDFANAILAVLDDDELRRRLGERGRATVEQLYSWEVIGHDLIERYLRVAHGGAWGTRDGHPRSEEHTSELQSQSNLVCRLLLEKKKKHPHPTTVPTGP